MVLKVEYTVVSEALQLQRSKCQRWLLINFFSKLQNPKKKSNEKAVDLPIDDTEKNILKKNWKRKNKVSMLIMQSQIFTGQHPDIKSSNEDSSDNEWISLLCN